MDIIFDIDGTVANIDHRLDYVKNHPRNYDAFGAGIVHDTINESVKWLYDYVNTEDNRILFASGRSDEYFDVTEQWLHDNEYYNYKKLYMRPAGDTRPDYVIKKELLDQMREDGYDPKICFDDRPSVVREWPKWGVFCFCVNQGLVEF